MLDCSSPMQKDGSCAVSPIFCYCSSWRGYGESLACVSFFILLTVRQLCLFTTRVCSAPQNDAVPNDFVEGGRNPDDGRIQFLV